MKNINTVNISLGDTLKVDHNGLIKKGYVSWRIPITYFKELKQWGAVMDIISPFYMVHVVEDKKVMYVPIGLPWKFDGEDVYSGIPSKEFEESSSLLIERTDYPLNRSDYLKMRHALKAYKFNTTSLVNLTSSVCTLVNGTINE